MRNSTIESPRTRAMLTAILLCSSLLFTAAACATSNNRGSTEKSRDGDLLRAVLDQSPRAVKEALSDGGNPNRIFGPSFEAWAMCAATRKGSEKILELLLTNDGNPSLVNAPASYRKEHPLTCALSKGNKKAFKMLVGAGADIGLMTCLGCEEGSQRSLFFAALTSSNFDIARELLDVLPVSDAELMILANIIETRNTLPGSEHARYTLEFIDYLAERGITAVLPYPMD